MNARNRHPDRGGLRAARPGPTPVEDAAPVVEIIAARQGEHSYPVQVGRGAIRGLEPLLQGVDRIALVT